MSTIELHTDGETISRHDRGRRHLLGLLAQRAVFAALLHTPDQHHPDCAIRVPRGGTSPPEIGLPCFGIANGGLAREGNTGKLLADNMNNDSGRRRAGP